MPEDELPELLKPAPELVELELLDVLELLDELELDELDELDELEELPPARLYCKTNRRDSGCRDPGRFQPLC